MRTAYDVIILGAGAAGLLCAMEAGKRGKRVVVLERAEKIGKKILISGGGRCNFTNLHCRAEDFLSENGHFAKSALARYTPGDFIALAEKHGIAYHEKTLGQLFCDRSARDIVAMLEEECRAAGVQIVLNARIEEVRRADLVRADRFIVRTENAEFHAPALVVATGGPSIPKLGATSFGYELARQFGVKIREPRPGLVPLVFNTDDRSRYCDLAGISAEVIACCEGRQFREKMLITHRGMSGPAILQISSYWNCAGGAELGGIAIDLAPGRNVIAGVLGTEFRSMTALRNAFQGILPKRLATRWLDLHEPARWSNAALEEFEKVVHGWVVRPAGTEGYAKAEVTVGGVDTEELSSKTMESKKVRGLYFIGEVVDVTGHLGGFNFQWAWASGAAAGRAV